MIQVAMTYSTANADNAGIAKYNIYLRTANLQAKK